MDPRSRRSAIRAGAGMVALCCVLVLVGSALAVPTAPDTAADVPRVGPAAKPAGPTTGVLTVVTSQGVYTGLHPGDREVARLVVYDHAGEPIYVNRSHHAYFDVDPVPGTDRTVEYVAATHLGGASCPDAMPCVRNVVERLNLSTGTVVRVHEAITPGVDGSRWHDVDRLNDTHLVVADIANDRVFAVDVRTDEVAWQWRADDHFPLDSGGPVADWTHLNDVEVLSDGRIMVSVRNMDQVVFLEPDTGRLQPDWSLGDDGAHDTLFEPHNPDYIPADRGGPAVLVADSENNRVIEYRRADGAWTVTWSWRDPTLQWPRDADRLPSGHTLIVDSHGDRVIEVDTDGRIVWSVRTGMAYDAERLGTGDESATGYAAGTATTGGSSRAPPAQRHDPSGWSLVVGLKDVLPSVLVNGLLFVAPPWIRFADLLVAGVLGIDLLAWGALEWSWSGRSVRGRLSGVRRPDR